MEIERKYLIKQLPKQLEQYPSKKIVQGYLSTNPIVRVRRQNDDYYLTYKGEGLLAREEYNLPLNAASFQHLIAKADGNIISKTRYLIPYMETYVIELDLFDAPFAPLILAEVEFDSVEASNAFTPPEWFGEEVTYNEQYHNSNMSMQT